MKPIATLLIEVFLMVTTTLHSQIVFNGSTTKSGSGVSSLSFTKTVGAGSNRLLVVGVTVQDKNITSVTYNGTAMTQFALATRNSMRVGMYYLAMGTSSASTTASVVVSIASSSDAFAGAADYSGVYQPAPFVNPTVAQAKSTTPSVTFTSGVGHKAVSLLGNIAASPTANGSGQTQYWSFTGSHSNRATEKAGAASVTMSHTISANEDWIMIGGTMQDNAVILPIQLIKFEGEKISTSKVKMDWETATEKNNDYFKIERSFDGITWQEVGRTPGAGNSRIRHRYSFIDELDDAALTPNNESKILYYRLYQYDFDGSWEVFKIIEVYPFNESVTELIIYPNPSKEANLNIHVDLKSSQGTGHLKLIDCDGKVLYESTLEFDIGNNDFHLSQKLNPGVYTLLLEVGNQVLNKKLIIN